MTHLTPEQQRRLDQLVAIANRLEGAREQLRDAALDAVDAGVPQTRVAEAADIGRMTLWRWLNERQTNRRPGGA